MIVVSVKLLSALDNSETELARLHILNDGTGTAGIGNYDCVSLRGRGTRQLDLAIRQRAGRVEHYRRLDLHVWNLVARALQSLKYLG